MTSPVLADAVQQTTNSSGSPFVMNSGVAPGYQAWQTAFASGQPVAYTVKDVAGNRETGFGTVIDSSGTVSRTTLLTSLPVSGTPPVFQSGAAIYCDAPAAYLTSLRSGVSLSSGQVTSGFLGNASVNSINYASGSINQFALASGVGGTTLSSGIVQSGNIGNSAVTSGNIGSGQVGLFQMASGFAGWSGYVLTSGVVQSANLASGVISQFKLASGAVNSGQIGSGAVQGRNAGGAFNIASGSIGTNDIGNASVLSGNIGSGQIGQFHLASGVGGGGGGASLGSGCITSGMIDAGLNAAVISGCIASGALATSQILSGMIGSGAVQGQAGGGAFTIASGTIGTNDIAPGAIVSGLIASGQIGLFHMASGFAGWSGGGGGGGLTSGEVTSGFVGNNAVLSGNIGSGQIGYFQIAPTYAPQNVASLMSGGTWQLPTAEVISGVRAVSINQNGQLQVAMASVSGRMPAVGIVVDNVASGSTANVWKLGAFQLTSGMANFSGFIGKPLYVGNSGQIVQMSGSWNSGGLSTTAMVQYMGVPINSGAIDINIGTPQAQSGGIIA